LSKEKRAKTHRNTRYFRSNILLNNHQSTAKNNKSNGMERWKKEMDESGRRRPALAISIAASACVCFAESLDTLRFESRARQGRQRQG